MRGVHGRMAVRREGVAVFLADDGRTFTFGPIQTILGHGSAAFSLTVDAHLFDADLDDVAARIQELPGHIRVIAPAEADSAGPLSRTDLRKQSWGREGSNLRPRDYESPALTTELRPRCFR